MVCPAKTRETKKTLRVQWRAFSALNPLSSPQLERAVSSFSSSSSSSSSCSSSFAREPASTRSPGAGLPCHSALWPRPKEPPSLAQSRVTSSSPCGQQRITTVHTMKKWAETMGTPSTLFRKCLPRAQPISTTKSEGKGREVTAIKTCFSKVSWIFLSLANPVCYMSENGEKEKRTEERLWIIRLSNFLLLNTTLCVCVCVCVYAKQKRTPQCVALRHRLQCWRRAFNQSQRDTRSSLQCRKLSFVCSHGFVP